MEKGYGHLKGDFITEFNPMEAGIERFVETSKFFPGKDGLEREIALGNRKNRALLELNNSAAPALQGETVFDNDTPIGAIKPAVWDYRTQKNLAMAYIDPAKASVGFELSVLLSGKKTKPTVAGLCLYDPDHSIPCGHA